MSQVPSTKALSGKAPSELCYDVRKGGKTEKRKTTIQPFQSIMVDDGGSLLSALFQADNSGRPINEKTAWDTKKNDHSENTVDVAQKLGWSIRHGSEITPLQGSFALIADGDGIVRWWDKKTAADGSIVSRSGTHCPEEELERDDLPDTDGMEVPQ